MSVVERVILMLILVGSLLVRYTVRSVVPHLETRTYSARRICAFDIILMSVLSVVHWVSS